MTTSARLHDLERADADWAWEADSELRVTRLCDRYARVTGRTPFEHVGRGLDQMAAMSAELAAAFERGEAFRAKAASFVEQGEPRDYRLSAAPTFADDGRLLGWRGTAVRGGADGEVRGAFLSNIGHEFRTPLNAIIGFAEMMQGELYGPLSDRYSGYAGDIAQAGRHLLSLIEDVLGAAERAGEEPLVPQSIDAGGLIDQAIRIVSVAAETRGITLRAAEGKAPAVLAEPRRLCQVLVNLLGNAIKFTPPGGRVDIGARGLAGGRVAIDVIDDGPGIAPADQERIFGRFERLTDREGSGLGLAIARDYAGAMGGRLDVFSKLGEGARFTVELPGA